MVHTCERCGYNASSAAALRNHLNRKKPCVAVNNEVTEPNNTVTTDGSNTTSEPTTEPTTEQQSENVITKTISLQELLDSMNPDDPRLIKIKMQFLTLQNVKLISELHKLSKQNSDLMQQINDIRDTNPQTNNIKNQINNIYIVNLSDSVYKTLHTPENSEQLNEIGNLIESWKSAMTGEDISYHTNTNVFQRNTNAGETLLESVNS